MVTKVEFQYGFEAFKEEKDLIKCFEKHGYALTIKSRNSCKINRYSNPF
jgi:hypothetical protein